jgi:hypothetical protein
MIKKRCELELDCLTKPRLSNDLARICHFGGLCVGSWYGGGLGDQ